MAVPKKKRSKNWIKHRLQTQYYKTIKTIIVKKKNINFYVFSEKKPYEFFLI